jgi:broad specificity phosphatase PhoE
LLKRHVGQRIAVVAHNVVNRAYLSHLLGLDINLAKNIEQSNTCVNVIEYDAGKDRASLVTLNANFHVPGVMEIGRSGNREIGGSNSKSEAPHSKQEPNPKHQ